jgi:hypothetical protein
MYKNPTSRLSSGPQLSDPPLLGDLPSSEPLSNFHPSMDVN